MGTNAPDAIQWRPATTAGLMGRQVKGFSQSTHALSGVEVGVLITPGFR
jgi:hypothetical protein